MNVLKQIDMSANMKDMVVLLIKNISFYIKHRDELNDIGVSNDFLNDYLMSLNKIILLYDTNEIPEWFKNTSPYIFLSSKFPYHKSFLGFTFSFKDWVDIVLYGDNIPFSLMVKNVKHLLTIKTVQILDSMNMLVTFNEISNILNVTCDEWKNKMKEFNRELMIFN